MLSLVHVSESRTDSIILPSWRVSSDTVPDRYVFRPSAPQSHQSVVRVHSQDGDTGRVLERKSSHLFSHLTNSVQARS